MTATIWRTCPSCGAGFEQPDDPGRKRVYCSRAASRPPTAPANAPAPASTPAARTSTPASASSAGRRRTAPTATTPGAAGGDELARIRRIIAALLRKAAN